MPNNHDLPEPAAAEQPDEDFRVRVAREKRRRMRERLLEATLDVFHPNEKGSNAVIDDVLRKADVSRGTFYKYFESLDEAVNTLGIRLATETLDTYQELFAHSNSQLAKIAGGTVLTLARAAMEPRWGLFTASVDYSQYASQDESMNSIVTQTLIDGKKAGLLDFHSIEAATDMLVGATVAAIKRLAHHEQRNLEYLTEVACLCMIGLGMSKSNARKAVREAWQLICAQERRFAWWQALDSHQSWTTQNLEQAKHGSTNLDRQT